ncbi:MAG: Serine protease Do-like HtrA [Hyphomicrobiaceae bacterium hypho_1]
MEARPRPENYDFDLERVLNAVVGITAIIPEDAITADVLGTERSGNGVIIDDGLILTIGYLVTEADTVWLTLSDGTVVQGHVLGCDQATGFGLVQALTHLKQTGLKFGDSSALSIGEEVIVCGYGGVDHAVVAQVVAKQEFAGYWEYVLDEAIFTVPTHEHWGGTAVLNTSGDIVGIGSLQVQHASSDRSTTDLNMIVPIDLLKPVFNDLSTIGRRIGPARPWLGIYAADVNDDILVAGIASGSPADRTDLAIGDIILSVNGCKISDLAHFFRCIWSLGNAGTNVPLHVKREGHSLDITVKSIDRLDILKKPTLH